MENIVKKLKIVPDFRIEESITLCKIFPWHLHFTFVNNKWFCTDQICKGSFLNNCKIEGLDRSCTMVAVRKVYGEFFIHFLQPSKQSGLLSLIFFLLIHDFIFICKISMLDILLSISPNVSDWTLFDKIIKLINQLYSIDDH